MPCLSPSLSPSLSDSRIWIIQAAFTQRTPSLIPDQSVRNIMQQGMSIRNGGERVSGYVHKKSGKTNLSRRRRRSRSRKHGEKSQRIPKLRGLGRFVLLQWIVLRSNGLSKDLDLLSISSSIYEVTSAYSARSFKTEDSTRLQVQALIISLAAPSSYLLQNTASAGHSEWWCFCLIFILAQITLVHFLWHFFHRRSLGAHARIKKKKPGLKEQSQPSIQFAFLWLSFHMVTTSSACPVPEGAMTFPL